MKLFNKIFFFIFFLIFCFGFQSGKFFKKISLKKSSEFKIKKEDSVFLNISKQSIFSTKEGKKALSYFKNTLNKYYEKNIHIKIKKIITLPFVKKTIEEQGNLFLKENQFRLEMQTLNTTYSMIFDGVYLWYHPDQKEKLVMKFKNHPNLYLFSQLFHFENFFNFFKVLNFKKVSSYYVFSVTPLEKIEGIKKIEITVGKTIRSLKIFSKDLNTVQYYYFSHLKFVKSFSKFLFIFKPKEFEILPQF